MSDARAALASRKPCRPGQRQRRDAPDHGPSSSAGFRRWLRAPRQRAPDKGRNQWDPAKGGWRRSSGGFVRSSERSVLTAAEKAVYSAGLTGQGVKGESAKKSSQWKAISATAVSGPSAA